jgi:PAS domain S-box-containing protein
MTGPPDDLASRPELLEHAPCGLLVTEPDGTIRLVNATFCAWTGYRAAELVHERRIQDLFTVGGRLFHHTHWLPLMQMQGSAAEVKFDILHREGHRVPMLFNAVTRQHKSRVYHELAVVVVHDRQKYEQELLQARKRAESALAEQQKAQQALAHSRDQLAQADRRKDEFLATLSHELRNPLSAMHNVLAILRRQSLGNPEADRLHGVLGRQVDYLTRLVSDLLDVSRIAQGKLQLRRQPTELASVVRDAVELVQSSIDSAAQSLDISLPPEPVVVDADPVRLTQVLLNLLHNATKYTPHGGHITLRATCDDDYTVICVRDSGVGIARVDLGRVFEMFSQVSGSAEHSQGGLGIGLALVRGLVALHDGTIEACSEGPGKGSEFVVRLPVVRARPKEEAMPPAFAAQPPKGRCRVVVIDDNQDAAESLAMLLELEGHEVRVAGNGLAGLELVRNSDAEVVLIDIGLPDIDGYGVARCIRQQPWGRKLLLVAVSGWGQERDRQAAADAGFDRHLTKPVDIGELTALLQAAC